MIQIILNGVNPDAQHLPTTLSITDLIVVAIILLRLLCLHHPEQ